jgi:hypothetical protein
MSKKTPLPTSSFKVSLRLANYVWAAGLQILPYDTEDHDLNNEYDLVTQTFTPRRAGYYLLQMNTWILWPVAGNAVIDIYLSGVGMPNTLYHRVWMPAVSTQSGHSARVVYLTPAMTLQPYINVALGGQIMAEAWGGCFFSGDYIRA